MTTARDIITLALFDAGIFTTGQTPGATDINNGLIRLNDMMSQWQRDRWLLWHLIDVSYQMNGSQFYTVGTGQQFDTPRPDRLETAFIRQINPPAPNQVDWPLNLVQSREAYSNIRLKQLGSFPLYIWYDADFPIGKVYPWPLPSNLYELHIVLKCALQSFPNLVTAFNMPAEFLRAIRFNLQLEFLSAYKMPPDPMLTRRAAAALNVIRNANAQVPVLQLPPELSRSGLYNIFTDNTI